MRLDKEDKILKIEKRIENKKESKYIYKKITKKNIAQGVVSSQYLLPLDTISKNKIYCRMISIISDI